MRLQGRIGCRMPQLHINRQTEYQTNCKQFYSCSSSVSFVPHHAEESAVGCRSSADYKFNAIQIHNLNTKQTAGDSTASRLPCLFITLSRGRRGPANPLARCEAHRAAEKITANF